MVETVFAVRDVCHRYRTPSGEVTALVKIDMDVRPGRLTVIAGPSGSGKSTLLRVGIRQGVEIRQRPSGGADRGG